MFERKLCKGHASKESNAAACRRQGHEGVSSSSHHYPSFVVTDEGSRTLPKASSLTMRLLSLFVVDDCSMPSFNLLVFSVKRGSVTTDDAD